MPRPIRLGLFAASPVYYQAPLYRLIAADPRVDFTATFASYAGVRPANLGFSEPVAWDADALSGYRSVFLEHADRVRVDSPSFLRHRDVDIIPRLRRADYEVLWVHGYSSLTHFLAFVAQLAQRKPLLVREEQTTLHPRPPLKRAIKSLAVGVILKRAYALYIGSENRRWFQSYGVPTARQFYVPYCVDNDHFQAEAKRLGALRPQLRREFGIGEERGPVILCVARLIPKKQPLFLLEAFRRVRQRHRCCLLFVGSGELESTVRREITQRLIPDVVLSGFLNQSQISRAYAVAEIFALPSKIHETWGLVVNEAMNFGLPLVVSDKVGSAADLVRDGVNGFVVSAEDPDELANRLEILVDSPNLRSRMGAESLKTVSHFAYDIALQGVLDAVAAAVGAGRWAAAGPAKRARDEPAFGGAA